MSELGVFAYCAAIGFAAAATIATFYQLVTSRKPELFSAAPTVPGVAFAVLLSMFAGPFMVLRRVITGLRANEIKALPALAGVVISGMWSACAGIFYVSLMVSA